MKLKADVQYYEYHCGCRVQRSELKWAMCEDGIKRNRCSEHLREIKHVCIKCPDCGENFYSQSSLRVRCDECKRQRTLKKSRDARKIKYHKMKAAGTLPPYRPEYKKKSKPIVDKTRRWECIHGDKCLNGEVFRNVEFNCHGCKNFEKIERHCDFYTKENERYDYA